MKARGRDRVSHTDLAGTVQAVRRFSRFYTRRVGVLHEGLLGGPLSLTEARIVYELAQSPDSTAGRLGADLGLDAGYLSRVLRGLHERGLLDRRASETDGRQTMLSLTKAGRAAFATLDGRSKAEIGAMIATLSDIQQQRLVAALGAAEALLGGDAQPEPRVPYILRPPRPGDMGWVVHRQACLYAEEYGFDEQFEALVAEIVAGFIKSFDPARERCWIAEREAAVVGSVFMVRGSDTVAKLRLLYVEPDARGLGIGRRLVDECIRFARQTGYRRLTLWTNDILTAARRIYQDAGFQLVAEERHRSFGHDLVGQNWDLAL
jgi:DNA-binding MarR family transcriptional regulator/GNAT superfamily N-acetyltransferase